MLKSKFSGGCAAERPAIRRYLGQGLIAFGMLALLGWGLLTAHAQPPTPTPGPKLIGPVTAITATSGPSPTPAPTALDARPAICAAPYQPAFEPYTVRPGDSLPDLLIGLDAFSLTQIAALNCLDDPGALPIGAVVWLPRVQRFIRADPFDADPTVDEARIDRLEASAETIANQAGVFFTWSAVGSAAWFYTCPPAPEAPCERPASAQPVPRWATPRRWSAAFSMLGQCVTGWR
jgi:hypothetical protein